MFQTATIKRAIGLALAIALTTAAGPAVAGEMSFDSTQAPSLLVGTWRVTTTPYICVTGQEFPQFARPQLVTFGDGGTVVEGAGNPDFQPGQRSSGHGFWEREGRLSFHAVFEAFILFTSVVTPPATPRYVRGIMRFDHGIEMQDADHWSSYASSRSLMSVARLCRPAGARRRLPSACVSAVVHGTGARRRSSRRPSRNRRMTMTIRNQERGITDRTALCMRWLCHLVLAGIGMYAEGLVAAPGDLDPAFGDHGRVQLPFDGGIDPYRWQSARPAIVRQPDGRVLVARADLGHRRMGLRGRRGAPAYRRHP